MLGSAVIVFREVLEAALIVAIVMGSTRGILGRGRWIAAGIAAGLMFAAIVAAFAGTISDALDGRGQELFNASVLLGAVAMLAWHNIWMSTHGRQIAAKMRNVGHSVGAGSRPLSALALVTFLAVLREGSETVLFLYGLTAAGTQAVALLMGGVMGLIGGIGLGWVIYRGLLAIPVDRLMTVVGWFVVLLAAGLAANAAGFLNQAGLIPSLASRVWDTSHILSQDSWLGLLLNVLIGYQDRPMGIQVAFYLVTVITLSSLTWAAGSHKRTT